MTANLLRIFHQDNRFSAAEAESEEAAMTLNKLNCAAFAVALVFAFAAGLSFSDEARAIVVGGSKPGGAEVPARLSREFAEDYRNCRFYHAARVGQDGEDVFCEINYTEAWTGRSWPGCWIQNSEEFWSTDLSKYHHLSNCRDLFGAPANFPKGRESHMVGCDIIGQAPSADWSRCECPPDRQILRAEGEAGAERCLTAEEDALADACRENGWTISEARNNDYRDDEAVKGLYNSAFFCDFPHSFSIDGAKHDGCVLYGPGGETSRAARPSCGDVDFADFAVALPIALPRVLAADYRNCRQRREVRDGGGAHAFCMIDYTEAWTGRTRPGCWIHKSSYRDAGDLSGYDDLSNCRDLFGSPADFPEGDRNHMVGCDRIGKVTAADWSRCECPPGRRRKFSVGYRADRCLTDEEAALHAACRENGWEVVMEHHQEYKHYEARRELFRSAYLCQLPRSVVHNGAEHNLCALFGPVDESFYAGAPHCRDVDFAALTPPPLPPSVGGGADVIPAAIPREFAADYQYCRQRREVRDGGGAHAFCMIDYTEAWTGRGWPGCWIYKDPDQDRGDLSQYDHLADCRKLFGTPADFPEGGKNHIVGCSVIGMADAGDWSGCECPPDRPNRRAGGREGAERCLSDAELARTNNCIDNGWRVYEASNLNTRRDEAVKGLYDSAFFCDFSEPVSIDGEERGSCLLYGPGDETIRGKVNGGVPSCGKVGRLHKCAGGEVLRDGACVCPPESPETFAFQDGDQCVGEREKIMLDSCLNGGWEVRKLDEEPPPSLACVIAEWQ